MFGHPRSNCRRTAWVVVATVFSVPLSEARGQEPLPAVPMAVRGEVLGSRDASTGPTKPHHSPTASSISSRPARLPFEAGSEPDPTSFDPDERVYRIYFLRLAASASLSGGLSANANLWIDPSSDLVLSGLGLLYRRRDGGDVRVLWTPRPGAVTGTLTIRLGEP